MRPVLLLPSLLLLAACTSTGTPPAAAVATTASPATTAAPAATQFIEVLPGLHAGGQPTTADLARLQAQGVHTVIDLRGEAENRGYDEAAAARHLGLTYVALPIAGADAITPANAAALRALLDEHGDGVLLHCASGNRVGALLALDGLRAGQPREQALALGRKAGLTSLEPAVVEKMDEASARCPPTQSGKAC